jgi:hypothetical protein
MVDVIGEKKEDARRILESKGFICEYVITKSIKPNFDENTEYEDIVIRQSLKDSKVVKLVINRIKKIV